MRVTFNTNMADLRGAIATAAQDLAVHQRELSTGYKINAPSDDPVGSGAVVAERSEMAATDQYQASADTAYSRLTVVDSALSELINRTTAAQSAVLSARGSTTTAAQREAAATTIESARDAIVSIMNTKFRGTYLFSGNEPGTAPYERTGDTISGYQGGDGNVRVDIDRQASVQVGFSGDDILKGSSATDLIQTLTDLAAAARSHDQDTMTAGNIALDEAFTRLTTAQTRVGNDEAQLDSFKQQLTSRTLAAKSRLSTIEDADLSQAVTDMNRANVAYQAALKAVSNASGLSLMDYIK